MSSKLKTENYLCIDCSTEFFLKYRSSSKTCNVYCPFCTSENLEDIETNSDDGEQNDPIFSWSDDPSNEECYEE
jgi:DNA-directed RNA polymerase subunit RPC12/RpoP